MAFCSICAPKVPRSAGEQAGGGGQIRERTCPLSQKDTILPSKSSQYSDQNLIRHTSPRIPSCFISTPPPPVQFQIWRSFSMPCAQKLAKCLAAQLTETTNFHGRSCSLIFRSRVGSLLSKKIPSPRFSPGCCAKAPASPPVLFVNAYHKPRVLFPNAPGSAPVLPRSPPGSPPVPPPVLPRFSPHSTPTVKISNRNGD